VSRTTYPYLYQAIGTTWGIGDGTTTFNVPDLRNRARVSVFPSTPLLTNAVSGITGSTVGSSSAAESTTLTTAQIPAHNHTLTDPGHNHTIYAISAGLGGGSGSIPINSSGSGDRITATNTTGISIASAGGGGAHTNVQPTAVAGLTFIKT